MKQGTLAKFVPLALEYRVDSKFSGSEAKYSNTGEKVSVSQHSQRFTNCYELSF